MLEVQLDPWLPEGWSGRADFMTWNVDRRAFVLGDLKTCKPEAISFIHKAGMKEPHLWQASAYWHALEDMGIPLIHGFVVYYLPTSAIHGQIVQPTLQEATPVPREIIHAEMNRRWARTKEYLAAVNACWPKESEKASMTENTIFLQPELEPVQPREFATLWDKAVSKAKGVETPGFKVMIRPNWSAMYCPFPNELCDCRLQKSNLVGKWTWNVSTETPVWTPARGVEGTDGDDHVLTDPQLTKLQKETHASSSEG